MTRVFNENGDHVPVTVLRLIPNTIVQKKSFEKDGYESIKVGYDFKKLKNLNKPKMGELKALGEAEKLPSKFTELPSIENAEVGGVLSAELFTKGSLISVTSSSKGKGFAGVMKRYGFAGGLPLMVQSSTEPQAQLEIEPLLGRCGKEKNARPHGL